MSVWLENSFPLLFIDNCIHKCFNKLLIKRVQNSTFTQKKEITTKISLLAKVKLTNIFISCCKDIKLNIVSRPSNQLPSSFRFKDQLPKCINSKVLDKSDICNNVYIDKTNAS